MWNVAALGYFLCVFLGGKNDCKGAYSLYQQVTTGNYVQHFEDKVYQFKPEQRGA
jgi:hypothetical protein